MNYGNENAESACYPSYRKTLCKLSSAGLGNYLSFGLEAQNEEGDVLFSYPDITPNETLADDWIGLLNREKAALIQVMDIVFDFLSK